jgi:methylase of polypeptide subunit release factors
MSASAFEITGLRHRYGVRTVLDLCAGSGSLAVLAAHAFPRARIDASDVSYSALAVARLNVRRHRLGGRVRVRRADVPGAGSDRHLVRFRRNALCSGSLSI